MVLPRRDGRSEAHRTLRRVLARRRGRAVAPSDVLHLARACELAARGVGSTAPNPPVGAVLVREGRTLGEGFHHRRGDAHAEIEALYSANDDAAGATLYVSLEPCDHAGLTPPCTKALIDAGVARVVIGALDPNPRTAGRGVARLQTAGIDVLVVEDRAACDLVAPFAVWIRASRPFVTLKMAASRDGYVAPQPGPYWLTGAQSREFVRELRCEHDAVAVGGGTVLVDDPRLTVRPPHARRQPYRRVCICDGRALPLEQRIFSAEEGYAPTLVLAAGPRERFRQLERVAEVVYVGQESSQSVEIESGLAALKERGVYSLLCEGGPRLAARFIEAGVVDRLEWLVAPVELAGEGAVPALPKRLIPPGEGWTIEREEHLGSDHRISARPSGRN